MKRMRRKCILRNRTLNANQLTHSQQSLHTSLSSSFALLLRLTILSSGSSRSSGGLGCCSNASMRGRLKNFFASSSRAEGATQRRLVGSHLRVRQRERTTEKTTQSHSNQ